MKKKAIITFANSNGNYIHGLARLGESLRHNFDGDFVAFVGEASCGAPKHADNPYAFKLHCFQKALDAGYEQVLWLDTSAYAVGNLSPIFDHIEQQGVFFQNSGHYLGTWSSDKMLGYFDLDRDSAMTIQMVQGGFIGLDFTTEVGKNVLGSLWLACQNGVFIGKWNNDEKTESQDERCKGHRHEMSALSAIVYDMHLADRMVAGDQIIQYGGVYDALINNSIIIKCQGL